MRPCRLPARTSAPKREPVPTRIGGFGGPEGPGRVDRREPDRGGNRRHASVRGADRPQRGARLRADRCGAPRHPSPGLGAYSWGSLDRGRDHGGGRARPRRDAPAGVPDDRPSSKSAPSRLLRSTITWSAPLNRSAMLWPVPRLTEIAARGPFDEAAEAAFLAERQIEVLVTKNSGRSRHLRQDRRRRRALDVPGGDRTPAR